MNSIYILKTIGAIFVLMIHFHFYKSQYLEPLYRCGVPIFFIISGYFLYIDNQYKQLDKYIKSIKKISKMIFFYNIIYFSLYLIKQGSTYIAEYNFIKILRLIIYGDAISGHLWFLTSYFWTLIILILCHKLKKGNLFLTLLAILSLVVEIFIEGQYAFLLNLQDFTLTNYFIPYISCSLPFISMGYFIHKYLYIFNTPNWRSSSPYLLVLLTISAYLEHYFLSYSNHFSGNLMISSCALTIILFIYCINRPTLGKGCYAEVIGREHSGNIYYWQFFPYLLFAKSIINQLGLNEICLPIMFIILLTWSYFINFTNKRLFNKIIPL